MQLDNKVVLVTGAAGNLGQALIKALLGTGARLALFDHRQDRLNKQFPELESDGRHLIVDSVDLTDEGSVRKAFDQVIDHFGQLDVLINAAGGYSGGTSIEETPTDTWEKMIALNAKTVLLACRSAVPIMRSQGRGAIVNIGARPGVEGRKNAGAYSASKSAVLRLTESTSAEVKTHGVRVNAVIPGTIDTPENRKAMPDADHERWVDPSAVADVILFLVSDQSRGICGACIPVYGTS